MSRHPLCLLVICNLALPALGSQTNAAEANATTLNGHKTAVLGLAFSPDGQRLVTTTWRAVREWDPVDGRLIRTDEQRGYAVAFSPDGKQVAYSGFEDLWLSDAASGELIQTIDAYGDWDPDFPFRPAVGTMVFSRDAGLLFTAGSRAEVGGPHGYPGGIVKIFDTATGAEEYSFEKLSHIPSSMVVSPDGRFIAISTRGAGGELPEPGEVRLWDLKTRKRLWIRKLQEAVEPGQSDHGALCVAFTPDGEQLLSAWDDGTLRLLSLDTGKTLKHLVGKASWFRTIAFSPDGSMFATGGSDGIVRLWDAGSREPKQSLTLGTAISKVAFSPDGMRIAAGGGSSFKSGSARVWELGDAPGSEK